MNVNINRQSLVPLNNTRISESNNVNESQAESTTRPTRNAFSELHLNLQHTLTYLVNRYNTPYIKSLYNKSPRENISRVFALELVGLDSEQLYSIDNNYSIFFVRLIEKQKDDNTILLISLMLEYMFYNTAHGTLALFEHCLRMNIDIKNVLTTLQDIQLLLDQLKPEIQARIFLITHPNAINNMQVLQQISSNKIAQQDLEDRNEQDNEFIKENINIINTNLNNLITEGLANSTDTIISNKIENWWHNTINDFREFQLNLETPPHGETTIFNAQKITNRVELIHYLFTTIDIEFNKCIEDKTPIIDKFQDAIFQLMSHMILYLNRLDTINNISCIHNVGIAPSDNEIITLLNEDEKLNITRTKPFVDAHCSIKLIITGITDLFVRIQHHYPS